MNGLTFNPKAILEAESGSGNNILLFTNVSVPTSAWSESSGEHNYEATISLTGVTASHFPVVVFDEDDVAAYELANEVASSTGAITIYADVLPNASMTILSISCYSMNVGNVQDAVSALETFVDSEIAEHTDNTTIHVTSTDKTNWNGKAPANHASSNTTYGTGTNNNYGHLKLSDSTSSTSGTSGGTAATPSAVKSVNDRITYGSSDLTAGTSSLTTGVFYAYYT